jgi:hypothetical protein
VLAVAVGAVSGFCVVIIFLYFLGIDVVCTTALGADMLIVQMDKQLGYHSEIY